MYRKRREFLPECSIATGGSEDDVSINPHVPVPIPVPKLGYSPGSAGLPPIKVPPPFAEHGANFLSQWLWCEHVQKGGGKRVVAESRVVSLAAEGLGELRCKSEPDEIVEDGVVCFLACVLF